MFGDEKFIETAEKALTFILETMLDEKRGLFHRYKDGDVAIEAFLDDYAYLIWALLEMYEATFKPEYLVHAKNLTQDLSIKRPLDKGFLPVCTSSRPHRGQFLRRQLPTKCES